MQSSVETSLHSCSVAICILDLICCTNEQTYDFFSRLCRSYLLKKMHRCCTFSPMPVLLLEVFLLYLESLILLSTMGIAQSRRRWNLGSTHDLLIIPPWIELWITWGRQGMSHGQAILPIPFVCGHSGQSTMFIQQKQNSDENSFSPCVELHYCCQDKNDFFPFPKLSICKSGSYLRHLKWFLKII